MKKLLMIVSLLSVSLFANFKAISAQKLIKMQKEGIPVIDIRTTQEWREKGVIKGAHLIMFFDKNGKYNIKKWMEKFSKLVPNKNEPFILYCAHAHRSHSVGEWLSTKMGYKKVYELKGGIEYGWKEEGYPVVKP